MSLKVPRGFVTIHEDAITARYAQMRQDDKRRALSKHHQVAHADGWRLVRRTLTAVTVVLTVAFAHEQILHAAAHLLGMN